MSCKETETKNYFDKVKVGDMLCVYTKRQYHGDNFFDRLKDCPVTCVSKKYITVDCGLTSNTKFDREDIIQDYFLMEAGDYFGMFELFLNEGQAREYYQTQQLLLRYRHTDCFRDLPLSALQEIDAIVSRYTEISEGTKND